MNTGISNGIRRGGLACAALVSLAGCVGGGGGFSFAAPDTDGGGTQSGPVIPKTTSAKLARGAVTVTAPKGYCIDETSVTSGLTDSAATLARCTSLDGKGASPERSAVMTVRVSARREAELGTPSADDLASAVAPAEVLEKRKTGAVSMIQVASGGDDVFGPADPKHWRGVTTLDNRLVLMGLYAPKGAPMAGAQGQELMKQLASGISVTRGRLLGLMSGTASGDNPQEASENGVQTTQGAPDAETLGADEEKNNLRGVFGRLFNRS